MRSKVLYLGSQCSNSHGNLYPESYTNPVDMLPIFVETGKKWHFNPRPKYIFTYIQGPRVGIFMKIQIWDPKTLFTQVVSFVERGEKVKQFTLRAKYVLGYCSAPIGGNFVKIHIWHDAHIPYTDSKFRLDEAIINPLNAELNPIRHLLALVGARHIVHVNRIRVKGTLLVEQRTFSSISRLPVERFSWILLSGLLGSTNIRSVEMGPVITGIVYMKAKLRFHLYLGTQ